MLRYANGRPVTSRRYDHLWAPYRQGHAVGGHTQQVSIHWIRHTTLTWVEGRGVASDASFPGKREDGAVRDPGPCLPTAVGSAWGEKPQLSIVV